MVTMAPSADEISADKILRRAVNCYLMTKTTMVQVERRSMYKKQLSTRSLFQL